MRVAVIAPILGLGLVGCATLPATQATPFLPAGVFGVYQDNDTGAIEQSAWAFASASNTRGNPIIAIRAVIALEYLSGELRENPRWVGMDQSVKQRMGQARDELRQILGIRPDAPPQMVVNVLLWTAQALGAGDPAAAQRMLTAPIFTKSPVQTLRLLSTLPYVQTANLATSRAQDESFPPGGARG
jgi:hypothetical protein